MKSINLDLNKLTDEQLKMYLELKSVSEEEREEEKQIQQVEEIVAQAKEKIAEDKKQRKDNKGISYVFDWNKKIKAVEDWLSKAPRTRCEILTKMDIPPHGGNYRTLVNVLKKTYKSKLNKLKIKRTKYYLLNLSGKTKTRMQKGTIFTKEMAEEINVRVNEGETLPNIKDVLEKKFGRIVTIKQITDKISNMKFWKTWNYEGDLPKPKSTKKGINFKEIKKLVDEGMSFSRAFTQVTGKKNVSGSDYKHFAKYNKTIEGETPVKIIEPKKDLRKEPGYLIRKNPFLPWKNNYVKRVMETHKMGAYEASRYLGGVWNTSNKNVEDATSKVELELKVGVEKPLLPPPLPEPVSFPSLKGIEERMLPVLHNMIERLKENGNLSLSYEPEGRMLGIDYYQDWVEFCKDFIEKGSKIASAMKIEDRFALVGFGKNGLAIKYR